MTTRRAKPKKHLEDLQEYDFGLINDRLKTLVTATKHKIDREWRSSISDHSATKPLVLGWYASAELSLATSRYLLADSPSDPARRSEFALSASPVIRQLADTLCSIVFLFGKPAARTALYLKSGWRELVEETERMKKAYGKDPAWAPFFVRRAQTVDEMRAIARVTNAEAANLKLIDYWPTPGQMIKRSDERADRRAYMRFIYDWFYAALSRDAHGAWLSIARSTPLLVARFKDEDDPLKLELIRTEQVMAAVTFMTAIITELELQLRFGLADRAKYIWAILNDWGEEPKDFYARFYEPILGPAKISTV